MGALLRAQRRGVGHGFEFVVSVSVGNLHLRAPHSWFAIWALRKEVVQNAAEPGTIQAPLHGGLVESAALPQTPEEPVRVGQTLSSFTITQSLGSGGMGEVYRARDAKLGRDVAIKVLRPEVAGDPDRLARFRREAHVLASLNHPHIAGIYGFEEVNGTAFLVLELVEGEDLAERLRRGPLPVQDALDIAKQIAEALEAAHERGVIHRDLKPANVKVTAAGTAKVLDFGLAKAWAGEGTSGVLSGDPSLSPTLASSGTVCGHDSRDRRIHVSRADARPTRGSANRRVGVRRRAVRVADGATALCGRHDHGSDCRCRDHRAGLVPPAPGHTGGRPPPVAAVPAT